MKFNVIKLTRDDIFLTVISTILFIISAFRIGVGSDFYSYTEIFNDERQYELFEFFPFLIIKLLKLIQFDNPQYFFITTSFYITYFTVKYININSKNVYISLFLYILLGSFFNGLNGIRQFLAVPFFLLSLYYTHKNQTIKAFLVLIVSFFFHFSIILILPFFIISKMKIHRRIYLLLPFILLLYSLSNSSFIIQKLSYLLPSRYEFYLDTVFINEKDVFNLLKVLFPYAILLISIRKLDFINNLENRIFLNYLFFSICLLILFPGNLLITRIVWYLEFSLYFLIPTIYYSIQDSKKRQLFVILTLLYSLVFFVVMYLIRNNNSIFPYILDFSSFNVKLVMLLFGLYIISYLFNSTLRLRIKYKNEK